MSALDEAAIRRHLAERGAPDTQVVVHEVTGSTNDDARGLLASGCASGAVVVADAQRAGRGRGGNVWQSPPGENLTFSLALRGAVTTTLPPFALVVGLCVVEVLGEAFGVRAKLKWPNDVWIGEEKVAGVLIEALHRATSPPALVVGVGINANQRAFPAALRATSIARVLGADVDRNDLLARLAVSVTRAFAVFEVSGFDAFFARAAQVDALLGRDVEVDGVRGRAAGIARSGALRIDDGARTVLVTSGHVALR